MSYVEFCADEPDIFAQPWELYGIAHAFLMASGPPLPVGLHNYLELRPANFYERGRTGWSLAIHSKAVADSVEAARELCEPPYQRLRAVLQL